MTEELSGLIAVMKYSTDLKISRLAEYFLSPDAAQACKWSSVLNSHRSYLSENKRLSNKQILECESILQQWSAHKDRVVKYSGLIAKIDRTLTDPNLPEEVKNELIQMQFDYVRFGFIRDLKSEYIEDLHKKFPGTHENIVAKKAEIERRKKMADEAHAKFAAEQARAKRSTKRERVTSGKKVEPGLEESAATGPDLEVKREEIEPQKEIDHGLGDIFLDF